MRRNYVLKNMLELGYIDVPTYDWACAQPITEQYHGVKTAVSAPYIAEMVRQDLLSVLGDKAYTMGLSVYTTVDSDLQLAANNSMTQGLLAYDKRHGLKAQPTISGRANKLAARFATYSTC